MSNYKMKIAVDNAADEKVLKDKMSSLRIHQTLVLFSLDQSTGKEIDALRITKVPNGWLYAMRLFGVDGSSDGRQTTYVPDVVRMDARRVDDHA